MNRNLLLGSLVVLVLLVAALFLRQDKMPSQRVLFATDWKAQAEHGGFYQALAKGYYKEAGINVDILQGGPGSNIPQLLATNTVQFGMGSNHFIPINMLRANAGAKAVMASFQKDPQVLITHPREDIQSIADMKGMPILIPDATIGSFWPWLRAKYGFNDEQIRKYTFNLAPFLSDENAIQEGYLSSEPYTIEKRTGIRPQVFLLADNGYPGYAAFVLANDETIRDKPELVQAFVDASIRGWIDYLYGDPAPANAMIKADNPEMTDDLLAHARATLKAYGVVDSGDALRLGVGAMTDSRWQEFYGAMSDVGVFPEGLDISEAYTLQFVNKGAGMELKKALTNGQ